MKFTVYTKGHFHASHQVKDHKICQKMHNHDFIYEVWVTAESLGEPGFTLIDVQQVDAYFQQKTKITVSIEEATVLATLHFKELLEANSSDFTIKVRLWQTKTYSAEYEKTFVIDHKV